MKSITDRILGKRHDWTTLSYRSIGNESFYEMQCFPCGKSFTAKANHGLIVKHPPRRGCGRVKKA